jgi:hypothetical protein
VPTKLSLVGQYGAAEAVEARAAEAATTSEPISGPVNLLAMLTLLKKTVSRV